MQSTLTHPIVRFFTGGTDHAGRTLEQVIAFDDAELEYTHDYIQWLFPLRESSPVNPAAPVVTDGVANAFAADSSLRQASFGAFVRMMVFYGFSLDGGLGSVKLSRAENFADRAGIWLTRNNHNMLRLTRILKSVQLLGHSQSADALFGMLDGLYRGDGRAAIGERTYSFWTDAVGHK